MPYFSCFTEAGLIVVLEPPKWKVYSLLVLLLWQNTWHKQLKKRNYLFCLVVSEVTVHHGRKVWQSRAICSMTARKQRKMWNMKGLGQEVAPRTHPSDLLPQLSPHPSSHYCHLRIHQGINTFKSQSSHDPLVLGNTLTDHSEVCFTNKLGPSKSNQVHNQN
jgi:hypothetical protein